MIEIRTLHALKDNFVYALLGPDHQCAVIDPGESAPVLDFLRRQNLRLTHILATHHHADHVQGIPDLVDAFACAVVASEHDRARVPLVSQAVSEAQPLSIWNQTIKVLDLPGHTLGQVAYWLQPEKALFPGDTLFSAGCGRLFEGTAEQMFHSLQKIKQLPTDTHIYFGHEYTVRNLEFVLSRQPENLKAKAYRENCLQRLAQGLPTTPSQLDLELQVNPFLRVESVEEFREWREARNYW